MSGTLDPFGIEGGYGMGGTDTARGMGFQTACALLQLICAPEHFPEADTFRVEGADEAIDFEVRDAQGQPLLLAQAKTRIEPGSWSGRELIRLTRRWGEADPDGTAILRFLSDAPVDKTGAAVRDAATRARSEPDPDRWLAECTSLRISVPLTTEDHALLRRLELETRRGPWEQILDEARLELLRLSSVAMAATEVDSTINALFVELFKRSGDRWLSRRTVRLDDLPGLLHKRRTATEAKTGTLPGPGRALFRGVPSAAGVRGRGQELTALRERFEKESGAGPVSVVVSGFGGIGKSSLARLYAHRHRERYDLVWWIPSDTREDVLAAYRRMLSEDRQETEPATEAEILTQVGSRLTGLGTRLLLVYDNVADRGQLQRLLPACEGAHVMITTRDSAWAAAEGGLIVERMTTEEATSWAAERLPDVSGPEISALVDAVEGIPLGIAQATGYIAATRCPVDVYLTELADCRARLLDDDGFVPLDYREGVTLTATVTLSVGKVIAQSLRSPEGSGRRLAAELLARCGLLAPDFIPLHLAALDLPTGTAVYGAVAELRRFSLVDSRDGMLAIHRIVQEIVRALMDGEAVRMMQGRFQHELVKQLVECQKQSAWAEAATLIEHSVHVAHHVLGSGHAGSDTVALLANVAGAISNVQGDLTRSERLLREALEFLDHASDTAIDDPVYRRGATTATLAQSLLNQCRFNEAMEAARTAWQLLEGADELTAGHVEHLLLAHSAEMRAAVATDRFADIARANARLETVLRHEIVLPSTALGFRLDQVQVLVWIQNWGDAAMAIDHARRVAPEEAERSVKLRFLDAIVKASTGCLEEALAITARIPRPSELAAVALVRTHADDLVEVAHALMVGSDHQHEKGVSTDTWILRAAESLIDQAEALLRAHTEAGPGILATLVHRRAILAWTRHLLGHPVEEPDLHRTLMRKALDLFEEAGEEHVPLAVNARQFLELLAQDSDDEPSETASADGPPHIRLAPSAGSGPYPVSEFPWRMSVALAQNAPAEARSLYGLLGASSYHLSGQPAPSPAFLTLAFAVALRSLGTTCRLIPTTLQMIHPDGTPLDLPDWQSPPLAAPTGEIRGHVTIWCEGAGRLVDPALLLGQSQFAPDAAERKVLRGPVVFPAPGLDSLLGISPATHREEYLLAYVFRPDWEGRLAEVLAGLDSTAVADFAQVLVSSAALAISAQDG
ncbi:regulatory protein AfsR [Streptomyces acidiscabies]|nr:regulatory protein AfsR [Streptomyces acidiscabies]